MTPSCACCRDPANRRGILLITPGSAHRRAGPRRGRRLLKVAHAAGSAHAAALEQASLSTFYAGRRRAFDKVPAGDAARRRPPLPLLPSRLSALTAHVVDCLREQRPPFRGFRGTTHMPPHSTRHRRRVRRAGRSRPSASPGRLRPGGAGLARVRGAVVGVKASPTTPAFGASASGRAIVPQWHTTAIFLLAAVGPRANRLRGRAFSAALAARASACSLSLGRPGPSVRRRRRRRRSWPSIGRATGDRPGPAAGPLPSAAVLLMHPPCSRAAAQTAHLLQLHAPSARRGRDAAEQRRHESASHQLAVLAPRVGLRHARGGEGWVLDVVAYVARRLGVSQED